jgi:hypothetical protein
MDTLSPTEALVALLVEQPNVDATNAIAKLRIAQERLAVEMRPHLGEHLDAQLDADDIDAMIIHATRNGRVDIFDLESWNA